MKVVRFHEHGGPEVLRVEEVAEPEPGPGQVRVRAEAIGVDAPDIRRATMAEVIGLLADGHISPRIHATMKLEDAAEAHRLLESGTVMGKLVLLP